MTTQFFLNIIPPTVTHQQKKVTVRNGKPVFYEPPALQEARQKLSAYLSNYVPAEIYTNPVRLIVKWCFPLSAKHKDGDWKYTKPDTDNLQKLLKDVMTDLHFWKDDALVCSDICEKFWSDTVGIYIKIEDLT